MTFIKDNPEGMCESPRREFEHPAMEELDIGKPMTTRRIARQLEVTPIKVANQLTRLAKDELVAEIDSVWYPMKKLRKTVPSYDTADLEEIIEDPFANARTRILGLIQFVGKKNGFSFTFLLLAEKITTALTTKNDFSLNHADQVITAAAICGLTNLQLTNQSEEDYFALCFFVSTNDVNRRLQNLKMWLTRAR
ncbi:MAG: hypothetical protein ACFFE8_16230 [Candidatus Heimdallarchaeota archaeon]